MKDKLKNKVAEVRAEISQKQESRIPKAPANLVLIVTIGNRNKGDFYRDFMQTAVGAHGTEKSETGKFSGLAYTEKAVLIGVAREDRKKEILEALQDKFDTVRGGGGIAYSVPLTSVIGVAIYGFLSNQVR